MLRPNFSLLTLALLLALPATAQDSAALLDRLDRLERDVNFVQKQVYSSADDGDRSSGSAPVSGNAEVRFSQLSEEIRQLRGTIEQVQFTNRQNATELKKLSDDMEFRLKAIEDKQAALAAAPPPASVPVAAPVADAGDENAPSHFDPNEKPDAPAKPALTGNDFPDANAHYSHAFKLLNDKKYSEAASSFDSFVKKYPSDPLTSNAYYWLGESYYARADFTRSSESFRKGFEANPAGQKAPDNLYKLAKSLGQVKRTNEACIVLAQVIKKYPDSAPRIVKRAEDERTALQCK